MDPHEFRKLGHELIDWVADYRERIGDHPVMSRVQPGEVAAQLPAEPPLRGEGLGDIVADLDRIRDAGHHALEPSRLSGLLPQQHRPGLRCSPTSCRPVSAPKA